MQPGPGAAAAGYLKKQELFSTSSHQSAMIDLLGETDSAPPRRPASTLLQPGILRLCNAAASYWAQAPRQMSAIICCLVSCRHMQGFKKSNDRN